MFTFYFNIKMLTIQSKVNQSCDNFNIFCYSVIMLQGQCHGHFDLCWSNHATIKHQEKGTNQFLAYFGKKT